MRILHITNWYPSEKNKIEGIFIREHIESLKNSASSYTVHLNFERGRFGIRKKVLSSSEESIIICTNLNSWFVKEILLAIVLFIVMIEKKANSFDIINFHIAYPLLTYWFLLKFFFRRPVVVNEHWSIYQNNFNLAKTAKNDRKLSLPKRIFFQNVKILAVSNSLINSIIRFSGNNKLNFEVLPNIVNDVFFAKYDITRRFDNFFTIGVWRKGKKPMIILEAFARIIKVHPNIKLVIGGEGEQILKMKAFVNSNQLDKNIVFVGWLDKHQVAQYMNSSGALVHCSDYETFSVVCAEAISCGCPPIVSNLDAVKEFCDTENSIIVPENKVVSWVDAIDKYLEVCDKFDREKMRRFAFSKFSPSAVGSSYYQILTRWKNEANRKKHTVQIQEED